MTKSSGVSLASLDLRKASEIPFEFEYVAPDGSGTGVMLKVLGAQCASVTAETNRMINERRRQQAAREAAASSSRPGDAVTPVEDDVVFGQRLAAVRLVGWTGIAEDWSPELALQLCQANAEIASQVLAKSNALSNFTRASSTAS